jgi:hypothetical protein
MLADAYFLKYSKKKYEYHFLLLAPHITYSGIPFVMMVEQIDSDKKESHSRVWMLLLVEGPTVLVGGGGRQRA